MAVERSADQVTARLACWLAEMVSLDEVPPAVRSRAAHLLLDGIGCGMVGARLRWSEIATDAICAVEGDGTWR